MSRARTSRPVGVALACVLVLAACSSDNDDGEGAQAEANDATTTTTVPRGSTADSGIATDWPVYAHDLANTRLNPHESTINADTVAKLTKSWSKDDLIGVTGTPAVSEGVVYFGDWKGTVWALRAETGEEVWNASIPGGFIVGAPAIEGDAVYISSGHTLYRLDRATGAEVWKVDTDTHPAAQINASPVVVEGLVLQGTASFENILNKEVYDFRGSIGAYDAETGEEVWKFYTTPNDATSGAGIGIWSTPAVDVERGLLYVGTGQNVSEPTGPLADSIIALDYKTGEPKWSKQFTYPDVFSTGFPTGKDADVGATPNLWTSDGRDLVGAGDKGGTFHALDRETGEIVWQATLTPGSVFGGQIGSSAFVDGMLIASSNVGDPDTNAPTDVTKVFGLDPATGDIKWTKEFPGKVFAPVSAVPGIAFIGTDRSMMAALDTKTGETLWSFEAPAQTACGPSIVDGRLMWGYGFTLFAGPGPGGLISFTVTP